MIEIKDKDFHKLITHIKSNYGIELKDKRVLVEGRLSNLILEKGFENFSQYLQNVLDDKTGNEMQTLINKITTNYTFFMRESVHFDFFNKVVLPYIEENTRDKDLRIWSAGCSSGEEAYTLAMLIAEHFEERKVNWDTKILATDISQQALKKAKAGLYSAESLNNMPKDLKYKYFVKEDNDMYKVSDKIKNEVVFGEFNLMEEIFPFKKKFHIIFCRNVMIYFDQKTKDKLVNKFYNHTEKGGYLFIGHSEFVNKEDTNYKHIMPAVYRKL
ncbi:MAG TPA: chemotaxis protein CheR [Clostridiales bacterium]|nr:MAG: chemotaxis protein CheR [Clostridiales bacterium GWD2_32_59]HAN10275.1 chemotaxis protein CheR [Clostridiales bacterium]